MQKQEHTPPVMGKESFNCPHCNVRARQYWSKMFCDFQYNRDHENYDISECEACKNVIFWLCGEIIYPKKVIVENPNPDLDKDIQEDYLEAARVYNESPRAAAAILRLALQKLCKQFGENSSNLNRCIANIVKKTRDKRLQKACDIVRIVGNNAVHLGNINFKEKPEMALGLFQLLNIIAYELITKGKKIDLFYETLSESERNAISKRDENPQQPT